MYTFHISNIMHHFQILPKGLCKSAFSLFLIGNYSSQDAPRQTRKYSTHVKNTGP